MRVHFVQSGGFAGLMRGCEIDTDRDGHALDADALASLERLSREAPPLVSSADGQTRDGAQYEIRIVTNGARRTHRFDDASLPDFLKPLIAQLKRRARPGRFD